MNYDEFKTQYPDAKHQSIPLDIIQPTICHASVNARGDQVQVTFFEGVDPESGTDALTHIAYLDRDRAIKLRDTLITAIEALTR